MNVRSRLCARTLADAPVSHCAIHLPRCEQSRPSGCPACQFHAAPVMPVPVRMGLTSCVSVATLEATGSGMPRYRSAMKRRSARESRLRTQSCAERRVALSTHVFRPYGSTAVSAGADGVHRNGCRRGDMRGRRFGIAGIADELRPFVSAGGVLQGGGQQCSRRLHGQSAAGRCHAAVRGPSRLSGFAAGSARHTRLPHSCWSSPGPVCRRPSSVRRRRGRSTSMTTPTLPGCRAASIWKC